MSRPFTYVIALALTLLTACDKESQDWLVGVDAPIACSLDDERLPVVWTSSGHCRKIRGYYDSTVTGPEKYGGAIERLELTRVPKGGSAEFQLYRLEVDYTLAGCRYWCYDSATTMACGAINGRRWRNQPPE